MDLKILIFPSRRIQYNIVKILTIFIFSMVYRILLLNILETNFS